MAHPYLAELQALVGEHLAAKQDLQCKHFFSGAALYVRGNICASLTPKGLAFKLSIQRSEELIASNKCKPLRYFDKSPVKRGYVLLPDYASREDEVNDFFAECSGSP